MNFKTLRPVVAAFVVASLAPAVNAGTLGNHPAVQIARTWDARGIDTNTFIVGHPAGTLLASNVVNNPSHSSRPADAQAQAASLLSRSTVTRTSTENAQARSSSIALDAQASAAAVLSGVRVRTTTTEPQQRSDGPVTGSAHVQAAALLSGNRSVAL